MKAILEFNLPEDDEQHKDALQGSEWRYAYQEALNFIREKRKYGDLSTIELQELTEKLHDILIERNLNID